MNEHSELLQLWDVATLAKYLGKSPRWVWSRLRLQPSEPGCRGG